MHGKIIKDTELLRLIDKENKSQSQAAKELGVSRQAVNNRLKQLRERTSYAVAAANVQRAVDSKLDVVAQLKSINQTAQALLAQVEDDEHLSVS